MLQPFFDLLFGWCLANDSEAESETVEMFETRGTSQMKQPKVILCSKSCSSHFGVAQLHIGTSNPYQKPILISFATLAADELSAIWQIFFATRRGVLQNHCQGGPVESLGVIFGPVGIQCLVGIWNSKVRGKAWKYSHCRVFQTFTQCCICVLYQCIASWGIIWFNTSSHMRTSIWWLGGFFWTERFATTLWLGI